MTVSTAQLALVTVSEDVPKNLHPREWAVIQTGLTNAQRVALIALASGYGGFQRKYGQFYIVEAKVADYLSIKYSTFRNYLTQLRQLGLLELVSRGANQHTEPSYWRMRLEVTCSTGQARFQMDIEEPEPLSEAAQDDVEDAAADAKNTLESDDSSKPPDDLAYQGAEDDPSPYDDYSKEFAATIPPAGTDVEFDALVAAETKRLLAEDMPMAIRREMKRDAMVSAVAVNRALGIKSGEPIDIHGRRTSFGPQVAAQGQNGAVQDAVTPEVARLPRAEKRRVKKAERKAECALEKALNEELAKRGRPSLRGSARKQAELLDGEWKQRHGGPVPQSVIEVACEKADERARTSFIGLVLRIISDEMEFYTTRERMLRNDGQGKPAKSRY